MKIKCCYSCIVQTSDNPAPDTYRYDAHLTARGKQDPPAVTLKGRPKQSRGLCWTTTNSLHSI